SDPEAFARQAFEEIAGNCFTWRETDGMYKAVKCRPDFAQIGKQRCDLLIVSNVAFENEIAAELCCEFGNAVLEAFTHIGKGQFCTFAFAGGGDAVGNRTVGQNTSDENFFTLQECHE